MTIAFDICDFEKTTALRCLRIDFSEHNLLLGYDKSMQYACPLRAEYPNVKEYKLTDYSIKDLAKISARWLNFEFSRKIERREWKKGSFTHQHYIILDIEHQLSWSDSENKQRFDLGVPTSTKIVFPILKN